MRPQKHGEPVLGVPAAELQYYTYQPEPYVIWSAEDSRGCAALTCNALWFVFGGGWFMWSLWMIAGCIMCLTIACVPCGLNSFKIACFAAFPFGKMIRRVSNICECPQSCGNILWFPLGFIMFIMQVMVGVVLFVTVIGIPFGIQHFKLSVLCLWPMGTEVNFEGDIPNITHPPRQQGNFFQPQAVPVQHHPSFPHHHHQHHHKVQPQQGPVMV